MQLCNPSWLEIEEIEDIEKIFLNYVDMCKT